MELPFQTMLNRHGRIQNILATHGYENTDCFFNMVLCVFMLKNRTRHKIFGIITRMERERAETD